MLDDEVYPEVGSPDWINQFRVDKDRFDMDRFRSLEYFKGTPLEKKLTEVEELCRKDTLLSFFEAVEVLEEILEKALPSHINHTIPRIKKEKYLSRIKKGDYRKCPRHGAIRNVFNKDLQRIRLAIANKPFPHYYSMEFQYCYFPMFVAYSPDRTRLAICGSNKYNYVWEDSGHYTGQYFTRGELILLIKSNEENVQTKTFTNEPVRELCFSQDGKFLAASFPENNFIRIWKTDYDFYYELYCEIPKNLKRFSKIHKPLHVDPDLDIKSKYCEVPPHQGVSDISDISFLENDCGALVLLVEHNSGKKSFYEIGHFDYHLI